MNHTPYLTSCAVMALSVTAGGFIAKSAAEFVESNDIWHAKEGDDD